MTTNFFIIYLWFIPVVVTLVLNLILHFVFNLDYDDFDEVFDIITVMPVLNIILMLFYFVYLVYFMYDFYADRRNIRRKK